jgi:lactoylglutathione lyase
MHMSYAGIRVTDMGRSYDFYTRLMGLRFSGANESAEHPERKMVLLLRDPESNQRLELNYYPPGSPYAVPYLPGEGLDHLAFKVDDLPAFLETLHREGVEPEKMAHYSGPMMSTPSFRVAFVRDPDGNQIELYDAPGKASAPFDPTEY